MNSVLVYFTLHVANVWQTCEWYREVFGLTCRSATPDGTRAELHGNGLILALAAAEYEAHYFGPFRRNSFLSDPAGFHLTFATADVEALTERAVANGAVVVAQPWTVEGGLLEAGIRDLNGVLVKIVEAEGH